MWYATIDGIRRVVHPVRPLEDPNGHRLVVVRAGDREYVVFDANNLSRDATQTSMPPAHAWHTTRRRPCTKLNDARSHVQRATLVVLVGVQVLIGSMAWGRVVHAALACTVGAYAHFGLQQMMHELSHRRPTAVDHALAFCADALFGLSGPGFYIYYMYHHLRHHSTVGLEEDPDAAFHNLWASVPAPLTSSVAGRLVWATAVGSLTKVLLVVNYLRGKSSVLYVDTPRTPLVASIAGHVLLWGLASVRAPRLALYTAASSALSLGALGHPCLFFWIAQHCANHATRWQPTMSYDGHEWVHALHLGALRHTEHHDQPMVPFYRMHLIPRRPDDCAFVSILDSIWRWCAHTDGTVWMDVGAQQRHVRQTLAIPLRAGA